MRKILKILCVAAALAAAAVSASAAEFNYTYNGETSVSDEQGLIYLLTSDTTAAVIGYNDSLVPDVVVPETIDYDNKTYTVNEIGECAFMPIAEYVFEDEGGDGYNPVLKSIKIPDSVVKLGVNTDLHAVKKFSHEMKKDCNQLIVDTLGSEWVDFYINIFPGSVFLGCNMLTNVELGKGIDEIPALAFNNCDALENIIIPAQVTKLGYCAFNLCNSIKFVTFLADSNAEITFMTRPEGYTDNNAQPRLFGNSSNKVQIYTANKMISDKLVSDGVGTINLAEEKTDAAIEVTPETKADVDAAMTAAGFDASSYRLDAFDVESPNGTVKVTYTFNGNLWDKDIDCTGINGDAKFGVILYNIPEGTEIVGPQIYK